MNDCAGTPLLPDTSFHPFHDGPVPHQHPDQPEDQVAPKLEPMEEHVLESIPELDIPIEHISVSSSEFSSEELHTTSISGPTSVGRAVVRAPGPLLRLLRFLMMRMKILWSV
ncbi:hypothetical protein AHAS_Ahas20G0163100 [Arachis hypogaea]